MVVWVELCRCLLQPEIGAVFTLPHKRSSRVTVYATTWESQQHFDRIKEQFVCCALLNALTASTSVVALDNQFCFIATCEKARSARSLVCASDMIKIETISSSTAHCCHHYGVELFPVTIIDNLSYSLFARARTDGPAATERPL